MFETWLRIVFWLSTKCRAIQRVVVALRDQLEHLALALGQLGEGLRGVARARHGEVLDHALGDVRAEDRLAAADRRDGAHDLVLIGALEQVAVAPARMAAKTESSSSNIVSTSTPMCGLCAHDLARRLDAVQLGHLQVHDDDVRLQLLGGRDRLGARRRLAHDLGLAERREQRAQPAAEDGMVVGDEDADRLHGLTPRAWEAGADARAAARAALDRTGAAELGCALAHRVQADAGAQARGEADAVVAHLELEARR